MRTCHSAPILRFDGEDCAVAIFFMDWKEGMCGR